MRQHRIVGSQRHASQPLSQSQGYVASQPSTYREVQQVVAPPLYAHGVTPSQSTPTALRRAGASYEVPSAMQRSFVRAAPPPPPATLAGLSQTTRADLSADATMRPQIFQAQTQAVVALTEALKQGQRDAASQREVQQSLRSAATQTQERLAGQLAACVVELRALRETLENCVERMVVSPPKPDVPPNASRPPRGSQMGINRVHVLARATVAGTSSPRLFPDPAVIVEGRVQPSAAVRAAPRSLKRQRAEPPCAPSLSTTTKRSASPPADQRQEGAAYPGQVSQLGTAELSFFNESGEDCLYLL